MKQRARIVGQCCWDVDGINKPSGKTLQGRRHEPSPIALELSALEGLGNSQTNDGAIRFDQEQLDIVTDFDLRRPDIVHPSRKPLFISKRPDIIIADKSQNTHLAPAHMANESPGKSAPTVSLLMSRITSLGCHSSDACTLVYILHSGAGMPPDVFRTTPRSSQVHEFLKVPWSCG